MPVLELSRDELCARGESVPRDPIAPNAPARGGKSPLSACDVQLAEGSGSPVDSAAKFEADERLVENRSRNDDVDTGSTTEVNPGGIDGLLTSFEHDFFTSSAPVPVEFFEVTSSS